MGLIAFIMLIAAGYGTIIEPGTDTPNFIHKGIYIAATTGIVPNEVPIPIVIKKSY